METPPGPQKWGKTVHFDGTTPPPGQHSAPPGRTPPPRSMASPGGEREPKMDIQLRSCEMLSEGLTGVLLHEHHWENLQGLTAGNQIEMEKGAGLTPASTQFLDCIPACSGPEQRSQPAFLSLCRAKPVTPNGQGAQWAVPRALCPQPKSSTSHGAHSMACPGREANLQLCPCEVQPPVLLTRSLAGEPGQPQSPSYSHAWAGSQASSSARR